MLDDFFTRALLGGAGTAAVAGPLGCFVVWRRMAYFGDTLAHSALFGFALAILFSVNLFVGVLGVSCLIALFLLLLQTRTSLPVDALLGILSHATLALGLVIVSLAGTIRVDLMGFLFGDILAITRHDLAVIYSGGLVILAALAFFWRALLADTASPELAEAEGHNPGPIRIVFMLLVATTIALAIKIVGVLLITALLIIPASTARRFTQTPEHMAIGASLIGVGAVVAGLMASL
ncbi:MAG: metal ABC transporter permease, partial [Pseudomonadota bacterium]